MSILVALLVVTALSIGGVVGGIWKITGALARTADRIGVGQLRGGLLINRFRIPLLLWAAALLAAGLVIGVWWVRHTPVLIALILGAGIAAVALFVLPQRAPALLTRLTSRGLSGQRS